MLRQVAFPRHLVPMRGAPPCIRARKTSWKVIHQSQKPPFPFDVDFTAMDLKYQPTYKPNSINKYGWSPKPETNPDYPFFIERTLVNGSVPVYTDFLGGRTKIITLLRRCGGDIETLRDEMSKVCDGKEVRIRTGRLEVDGNYSQRLKRWIIGLGF